MSRISKTKIYQVAEVSDVRKKKKKKSFKKESDLSAMFRRLFKRTFKEFTGQDYPFRKKRVRTVNGRAAVVFSDYKRLNLMRQRLPSNNIKQWRRFLRYMIYEKWGKSGHASVTNLIGYMENEGFFRDFLIQENKRLKLSGKVGASYEAWSEFDRDKIKNIDENPELCDTKKE